MIGDSFKILRIQEVISSDSELLGTPVCDGGVLLELGDVHV
jgi:hypothetical protein